MVLQGQGVLDDSNTLILLYVQDAHGVHDGH